MTPVASQETSLLVNHVIKNLHITYYQRGGLGIEVSAQFCVSVCVSASVCASAWLCVCEFVCVYV